MRCFVLGAALIVSTGVGALGQYAGGVNVDLNATSGTGAGTPSAAFGGAAGQPGFWTLLNPPYGTGVVRQVRDLTNTFNAVTCTLTLNGATTGTFSFNNPNTLGDVELLMDDAHDIGAPGNRATYTFSAFAPGVYEVITYAAAPDSDEYHTGVTVTTNDLSYASRSVGGAIPAGGVFTEGVTHSRHTVCLAQSGPISVTATTLDGFGSVNGMQIRRLSPTRLYVDGSAQATNRDGLSWGTALETLQWALAVAAVTPSVTEVWVKQGTHHADAYPATAGSSASTFRLRSNLALYGGFVGTETALVARPIITSAAGSGTVLDGSFVAGGGRVNSVVTADGVGATAVLDGFEVCNGGSEAISGGGLRINNGSPRVRWCTVRDNVADTGGGVSIQGTGDVLLEDCLFTRNAATTGSAVLGAPGAGSSITMRRCAAVLNSSTSGTAGTIGVGRTLVMENCLVANNDSPTWAMDLSASPSVTMLSCTVAGNRGTLAGGSSPNVGVSLGSSSTLRNCVIFGNAGAEGAGTPQMSGVLFKSAASVLLVSESIVQAWDGTLSGPELLNFDADPRFMAVTSAGAGEAGDYRLRGGSPAIDSGRDAAVPAGPDLNGWVRVLDDPCTPNTGFEGGIVDRGCYESVSTCAPCPGDIGGVGGFPGSDGQRDNNDFIAFIDLFFALDPRADVGRVGGFQGSDGLFDNNDFVAFIDMFFSVCP